jgi:CRP-like cAMP-binding protein
MPSEVILALKSLQGFNALGEPLLEQLVPFVSLRAVRTGETVFCQGEPSPFCFGVLSGEVIIQRVSKDHRFPTKVLGVVGPNGLFGESSIFEEGARVAMASVGKEGKLVVIRGPQLREWIQKNPEKAQPLLLALLQTSLQRLNRTSHELAVVYGVARILGSAKPFSDQLSAVLEFLIGSLEGLDDLVFYQKSAYWEEFAPVLSMPVLEDLPAIPAECEFVKKVSLAGAPQTLDPQACRRELLEYKLPWENRLTMAVVPLFDWDKAPSPMQGLLLLASSRAAQAFSTEKQLLLTSISHPLAEALSRHGRQEDASAHARLQQSKKSFPQ